MADDKNLDLLDLEEDDGVLPELPESSPFCTPRPKRPWLLFALGALVIVLATYIIISVIRNTGDESIDISLDVTQPTATATDGDKSFADSADKLILGKGEDKATTAGTNVGAPTRVVGDREEVKFNPNATPKVEAPKPRPISKPEAAKPRPAATTTPAVTKPVAGGWHVQFASLSTRAAAESAANRMKSEHSGLLGDRQFLILAAELPNGTTTYRVRIGGFSTSSDANGFCRNAQSDGLDCYVVKQ